MIKKVFLLFAVAALVVSCDKKQAQKAEEIKDSTSAIADTLVQKADSLVNAHTSENSLDVEGVYKGVIPCADCEGIETILKLEKNNMYTLSSRYLGKGDQKPFESKGKYVWSKEGNKITLDGDKEKQQFKVAENQLIQLDTEGNVISGELASKYTLLKQK